MPRGEASRRPLPRAVKQLGTVSFFNDLASEMVYPLLPALITTRLGGTAVALGALDGISEAVAAAVKAPLFGILYEGLGGAIALAVSGSLAAGLSIIGAIQSSGESRA